MVVPHLPPAPPPKHQQQRHKKCITVLTIQFRLQPANHVKTVVTNRNTHSSNYYQLPLPHLQHPHPLDEISFSFAH